MKSLLKLVVGNGAGLYILTKIFTAFRIDETLKVYVIAAVTLSLLQTLVRPLVELVLLPVNLLTLGMFRWVSSVAVLWLMVKIVPGISVLPYHFAGFSSRGIVVPAMDLTAFWSIVVSAFLLSSISTIIDWLTHR